MKFDFRKYKYEKELLIDCEQISNNKHFVKDNTPFHVSFHEIFFLTKGKGIFKLDDESIAFRKGTIIMLPPHKRRQWAAIDESFDGFFLIFEEEFITNFFNDALFLFRLHYFYNHSTPSFIQANRDSFEKLITKLKEVQKELKGLRKDSHHLLRSLLYYLLIKINRMYEREFDLKDELYQDGLTLRFRKVLEERIRTNHKVSDYAEKLNVSRSHLNKVVKKYFGKSCSEIIKDRLVAEIKKDLLFSDKTVAQISYALDFSEPGNCTRFFKKRTHLTPHQYRSMNSK